MNAARWVLGASIALFIAGCDRASPEGNVVCGNVDALAAGFVEGDTGAVRLFLVVKTVEIDDPGAGSTMALNGASVRLVTTFETIGVCEGDCLDGTGDFGTSKTVETDENGILLYTVGAAYGSYTGDVTEIFSSTGSCNTEVSGTVAAAAP